MTAAPCCRSLKQHLQNIECNSTSAVAITHHFLTQLVSLAVFLLTVSVWSCLPSTKHSYFSCVLPQMRTAQCYDVWTGMQIDKKLKGCIVFTSSAAACIPSPFGVTYAASKSFLSSFGASLAPEVKKLGIDVMVAHPSPVSSRYCSLSDRY